MRQLRLGRRKTTVVVGVVDPSGAAGGGVRGEWKLSVKLKPWRRLGDPLVESQLSLSMPMDQEEVRRVMKSVPGYMVLRARVDLSPDDGTATIVELLGEDATDEELMRRSAELQVPATFEHEYLGTLLLDRTIDWWETELVWNGATITLSLQAEDAADLPALAATAEALHRECAAWEQRVRERAADDLLELANHWREDDDPPVTREDFIRRIPLESITVASYGFEFWFGDDEIFLGHSISVSGNLDDGPTEATMQG